MKKRYVVAIYELDRAYGGPEEGGWWYDTGTIERVCRIFNSEDAAYIFCNRMNRLLDHRQRNKLGRGSMAYSGGEYGASVFENYAPRYFPERTPYYE